MVFIKAQYEWAIFKIQITSKPKPVLLKKILYRVENITSNLVLTTSSNYPYNLPNFFINGKNVMFFEN